MSRTHGVIENQLLKLSQQIKKVKIPYPVLEEAKKRVLDSLGCYFGAFDLKPSHVLRKTFLNDAKGTIPVWGTKAKTSPELAAWINGAGVRALDFNDTYLSKEPCHPSDLLSSLWTACETTKSRSQGPQLLKGLILGYEVLCRLCDAKSLRVRGWDHVTYLPMASAVSCSTILGLSPEKTKHAISLSMVSHNALRQTRVGTISDWKAACAAYAARNGLWAARLAHSGFTGPSQIFSGRHGFWNQVSGPFSISGKPLGSAWKILSTHTKFFPAEHHSQSAIEAAAALRNQMKGKSIRSILIETFDVGVDIIGSEPEKWAPTTRETADHSLPYLVVMALLEGKVTLDQYAKKKYLSSSVRRLLKKVKVKNSLRYSRLYPKKMPTKVSLTFSNEERISKEIMLPCGYAGRPMSWAQIEEKFNGMARPHLGRGKIQKIVSTVKRLDKVSKLSTLSSLFH